MKNVPPNATGGIWSCSGREEMRKSHSTGWNAFICRNAPVDSRTINWNVLGWGQSIPNSYVKTLCIILQTNVFPWVCRNLLFLFVFLFLTLWPLITITYVGKSSFISWSFIRSGPAKPFKVRNSAMKVPLPHSHASLSVILTSGSLTKSCLGRPANIGVILMREFLIQSHWPHHVYVVSKVTVQQATKLLFLTYLVIGCFSLQNEGRKACGLGCEPVGSRAGCSLKIVLKAGLCLWWTELFR